MEKKFSLEKLSGSIKTCRKVGKASLVVAGLGASLVSFGYFGPLTANTPHFSKEYEGLSRISNGLKEDAGALVSILTSEYASVSVPPQDIFNYNELQTELLYQNLELQKKTDSRLSELAEDNIKFEMYTKSQRTEGVAIVVGSVIAILGLLGYSFSEAEKSEHEENIRLLRLS